jgi:hypothetical protein
MGRRAAIVATTVVAAAGGIILTTVPSGGGGDPATANLHVDANGGTCVDNASAVSYSDATACTWDAANDTCEAGDTVLVQGGSYGTVTLSGSNSRTTDHCTFTVDTGDVVTMTGFNNGQQCCGDTGADWIEINGNAPCRFETATCSIQTTEFDNDNNAATAFYGWDIDGGGSDEQIFHVEGAASAFTWRQSRVHEVIDAQGMSILTGSTGPWLFEDSDWYDVQDTTGGAVHTECAWTNMDNVIIRRTRWGNCAIMDLFLTGGDDLATDFLIENSVFQKPVDTPNENALAFRSGSAPSPSPDGFILRYNTIDSGVQINGTDNQPTANGFEVYGNYIRTGPPCGLTNATYSYNVTPDGTSNCGGTGAASFSLASLNAGFPDPDTGEGFGNYNILTGSPLKNIGDTGNFTTLDAAGNTRYDGSAPDIGAYEFQE